MIVVRLNWSLANDCFEISQRFKEIFFRILVGHFTRGLPFELDLSRVKTECRAAFWALRIPTLRAK